MTRTYRMHVVALVALAGVFLSCQAFGGPPPPKVGDVLAGYSDTLNQWPIVHRGFWCKALNDSCAYALLNKGTDMIVAIVKPTKIGPYGGYEEEVITKTFAVAMADGERGVDCVRIDGHDSLLSLLNERKKTVRVFYLKNGQLALDTHRYKAEPPCQYED